jgi:hypothetical protein
LSRAAARCEPSVSAARSPPRCPARDLRFESLRKVRRGFERVDSFSLILRRGRDSNPASGVGDNLKRHATLHTNALKFGSKWFGSLSPRVPGSRRGSSAVGRGLGSGWAATEVPRSDGDTRWSNRGAQLHVDNWVHGADRGAGCCSPSRSPGSTGLGPRRSTALRSRSCSA